MHLQCMTAGIVVNVHMVTEILPQVFIRCYHLHLPSFSSVVPQAFGAL